MLNTSCLRQEQLIDSVEQLDRLINFPLLCYWLLVTIPCHCHCLAIAPPLPCHFSCLDIAVTRTITCQRSAVRRRGRCCRGVVAVLFKGYPEAAFAEAELFDLCEVALCVESTASEVRFLRLRIKCFSASLSLRSMNPENTVSV